MDQVVCMYLAQHPLARNSDADTPTKDLYKSWEQDSSPDNSQWKVWAVVERVPEL